MKPALLFFAVLVVTMVTGTSTAEEKQKAEKEMQQQLSLFVEDGEIRISILTESDRKPGSNAVKILCGQARFNASFRKDGKRRMQIELAGDVKISGSTFQLIADNAELEIEKNNLRIQAIAGGNGKVRFWREVNDGERYYAEAKRVEFNLPANRVSLSGATVLRDIE